MDFYLEEEYVIYQGKYKVLVDDFEYIFDGKVYVKWVPTPKICFEGRMVSSPGNEYIFDHFVDKAGSKYFIVVQGFEEQEIDKNLIKIRANFSVNTPRIDLVIKEGILDCLYRKSTIIDTIEFSIVNFPNTPLQNSIKFQFQSWEITITKQYDFKKRGLYVRTFRGKIKKIEAETFLTEEAQPILSTLQWLLSFASAKRVGVCLLKGMLNGQVLWEFYRIPQITMWDRSNLSWFNTHNFSDIATLFPSAYDKLQSSIWSGTLYSVLTWYIESSLNGTVIEKGIVLIQSALETIAWTYLVQDKKIMTPEEFKPPARRIINNLLNELCIPTSCDADSLHGKIDEVGKRIAQSRGWNEYDGAKLITDLRNSIVHPKKQDEDNYRNIHWKDRWSVLQLGIWYLELSILRLLNFNGTYQNRWGSLWTGDAEPVPWVKTN